MNIQNNWKAKLESAYSFMLEYSKITVQIKSWATNTPSGVEVVWGHGELCKYDLSVNAEYSGSEEEDEEKVSENDISTDESEDGANVPRNKQQK